MGSTDFTEIVYTTSSAKEAFRSLVDAALEEYGYDAYNGTISTTDFCGELTTRPVSLTEAYALIDKELKNIRKWDCYAIPIYSNNPAKRRTVKVAVTIRPNDDFDTILAASVRLKANEHISHYTAQKDTSTSTVTASAAKEKTVTKYFVVSKDGFPKESWESGYSSQAEARAAAIHIAKNRDTTDVYGFHNNKDLEVIGITRRESGAALVDVVRTTKKTVYQATVTIDTAKTDKQDGWAFYGCAAE
jgi:hypothetical protein